jgi:transcriptional regulator with XRE-family HTH domain
MTEAKAFGERIRALRKERRLDQRSLAAQVAGRLNNPDGRGFDVTYLSKIENGNVRPPSTAAIIALAEVLLADADELIALAGKVPPDIGDALKASEGARIFYRSAIDLSLTEEDWKHLLEEARRRKGRT